MTNKDDINKTYDGSDRSTERYGKTSRGEKAGAEEKPQATKIKLRLDVKDVVRKPKKESDGDEGITVLYEDNHLLVVLKPQNIPTQADNSGDPDMLSMLKEYLVKKYNKPGEAYLGLVHRLDRPTGGVMVFAKTSKAAARLCEQIKDPDSEFEKTYLAVVSGRPSRTGRVEHYLVKDEKSNTVSIAPSSLEGAKKAESVIKIEDERGGMSLVSVKLLTGRSHQARVQLKALGSPIAGDVRYAGDKLVKSPHLALWAYKLVFTHPVGGDKLKFIALPPDEFPWNAFDTEVFADTVRPVGAH